MIHDSIASKNSVEDQVKIRSPIKIRYLPQYLVVKLYEMYRKESNSVILSRATVLLP